MKKTIGIVYAISEIAGDACYERLSQICPNDVHILTYKNTQKEQLQTTKIIEDEAKKRQAIAEILYTSVSTLAEQGADIIIIAANSVHIAFNELTIKVKQSYPHLHLLSIVDAVTQACINLKSIAILGSDATVQSNLYQRALAQNERKIYPLLSQEQYIINEIVSSGKMSVGARGEVQNLCSRLKHEGCEAVILACTELPLLLEAQDYCGISYIDSTEALIQHSMRTTVAQLADSW